MALVVGNKVSTLAPSHAEEDVLLQRSFKKIKNGASVAQTEDWPMLGKQGEQYGISGQSFAEKLQGINANAKDQEAPSGEQAASDDPIPLSESEAEEVSICDASNVLRDAFSQTEACLNHYYEGCTATVLLVWADDNEKFFAQCANVGDSACVMNVDGKEIKMTEDHKIASYSERLRIEEAGEPLRDGETRLYGINLARMLGDKFLKQQDCRFSSEPYISQAVPIDKASRAFAILASDGLWDVMSGKKAIQLVFQKRDKYSTDDGDNDNSAEKVANLLLSEARTLRTKDNTSIIFLDFDTLSRFSCKAEC